MPLLPRAIKNLRDVVDWGLCTGCGACFYACDRNAVSLVNIQNTGIRPVFSKDCGDCVSCLAICPGYTVPGEIEAGPLHARDRGDEEFGPALEIWEGYAADPQVRFKASSGGILSALAIYCLEHENMGSVLHTGMNPDQPWLNQTRQSRTRAEVLSAAGSRYAPASPCDGLAAIEQSEKPCVFIGKPCDTTAVAMVRRTKPELDRKLGLVLTFFCAGTPSTDGTFAVAKSLNADIENANEVRYRGEGWPGEFKVITDSGVKSTSYMESWGKLTKFRPFRCNLCPDGIGRVADITCGDAWESYEGVGTNDGRSLVIVRTERGRRILHGAIEAGYVKLWRKDSDTVIAAQPNLLKRRQELFGRLLAMRLLLVPVPRYTGFALFRSWWRLPVSTRIKTVLGTAKRIVQRGLWHRKVPQKHAFLTQKRALVHEK